MRAYIITIGDEILIGQTVDTNSAWMAKELNLHGISVAEIISISDRKDHIEAALDVGILQGDVVLMTGGLGPTKDDITKYTLADYFGTDLVHNQDVQDNIDSIFKRRGYDIPEVSKKMSQVPADARIFVNAVGTAAGMWFEIESTPVISMPGVPHEMKKMMRDQIVPALKAQFATPSLVHKHIMTAGIGESRIAEKIADIEDSLPANIKLAYLPEIGSVKLRLSATNDEAAVLESQVESLAKKITERIPNYVYGYDGESLEAAVGRLLTAREATLGLAESCSGGKIAKRVVAVPGASSYFHGSFVAYSYEMKEKILGVNPQTLQAYGAVSEECVTEMLEGTRKRLGVDYAIAVSGIAGPGGGTPDKPVGTIYIGVCGPDGNQFIKRYNFPGNREIITELSAVMGLQLLKRFMLGQLAKPVGKE